MKTPLTLPAHESNVIRVFAINKPVAEVALALETLPKPDLARQLLGNPHLDTARAEIFPVSDLTGMGLAGYLVEGYAAQEAHISPDRAKLDALEGYVLLLFSNNSTGTSTTLNPGSNLTLIGTYSEYQPPTGTGAITSDSAKPYSGTPGTPHAPPKRSAYRSLMIVLACLLILAVGVWAIWA